MLKLYKWLVYIIMRPCKSFQHLIKCLANYFSTAKQIAEKKTENRKRKEGLPQMGPTHRGSPAQGQGRLLPRARQAAAAVASMPSMPSHLLLSPRHISTPGDAQELPHSIPPLLIVFPFLSHPIRRRPRR